MIGVSPSAVALCLDALSDGVYIADAVLGTAQVLRHEPGVIWQPSAEFSADPSFTPPLQAVLTKTGRVDFEHPLFQNPDLRVVVYSGEDGLRAMAKKCPGHVELRRIYKIILKNALGPLRKRSLFWSNCDAISQTHKIKKYILVQVEVGYKNLLWTPPYSRCLVFWGVPL